MSIPSLPPEAQRRLAALEVAVAELQRDRTSHSTRLNDLIDVSAGQAADGQVLTYQASSGLWVPATP